MKPTAPNSQPDPRLIPLWQRERSQTLHRVCRRIDRRINEGEKITSVLRRYSRLWRGRFYRIDPHRRVRLSYPTLVRIWYRWNRTSRSPEAFHLRYSPVASKFSPSLGRKFVRICAAKNTDSFSAAARKLIPDRRKSQFWSVYSGVMRAVPRRTLDQIRLLHKRRKSLAVQERRFTKFLESPA